MTPEMAFECLLVTPDPAVSTTVGGILQDFSIATKVCPYPSKAADLLSEGSTDLIVIDLEAEDSPAFLCKVGERMRQKPTVLGVTAADYVLSGVHGNSPQACDPRIRNHFLEGCLLENGARLSQAHQICRDEAGYCDGRRAANPFNYSHQYRRGWSRYYKYRDPADRRQSVFSAAATRVDE